jgi:uncharacterized metal-binding protein
MKAIVTCSGVSNTGKLTTQAAVALLRHDPGSLEWIRAGDEPGRLLQTVEMADQVIVINGCADCCAKKKLQALGVVADREVIATDLGVVKNGMADPEYSEIDLLVKAVRKALDKKDEEAS